MRTYSRDEVKKILEELAGDRFVNATDDGAGFAWMVPDDPAANPKDDDPMIPRHAEYFDFNVEAAELIKQLREAHLIKGDEGDDAEAFLGDLLQRA
jgi:hypothetical protein